MTWQKKVILIFSAIVLAFATVGCEKEGGAEKTGKKIDNAFNTVKDKIHKATE
jgi:hypothetical protein